MLREHLVQFLNDIHWNTLYNLEIEEQEGLQHLLEAYMNMNAWIIHFNFPPKFLYIFQNLINQENYATSGETPHLLKENSQVLHVLNSKYPHSQKFHVLLRDLLAGIAYHEYGHSKECPIDKENFAAISQAVSTVLEQESKYNQKILRYIVNMFTDLIVNATLGLRKENRFFRNAIFMFYYSEILLYGKDDLAFCFFLLLNTKLYLFHQPIRDIIEKQIILSMKSDYTNKLKKLLEIFCPFPKTREKMWLGVNLDEDERWKMIQHLGNELIWDEMAYRFTKIMLKFVPDASFLDQQPIPDSIFTKKFFGDSKFRSEVMDEILARKLIKKKALEKQVKEILTQGKYGRKSKRISGKHSRKIKLPPESKPSTLQKDSLSKDQVPTSEKYPGEIDLRFGLASFLPIGVLDALYKYRIKEIQMKFDSMKKSNYTPITWLNRQILSKEDNLMDFDPLMVYFLPDSDDLLLFRKNLPLKGEDLGSIVERGFPNLSIFCDDSGSMGWKPYEGTGEYDAVLIMIYSILNWLKSRPFAASIQYNFTCFSDSTRSSGWIDYYHLNDILPIIFNPEQGGTVLDIEKFTEIINHPKEKVVILITDGEIRNERQILEVLKQVRYKIKFLFVQIGRKSKLAKVLDLSGFAVIQIKDISNLSTIVLDFMKKSYHGRA